MKRLKTGQVLLHIMLESAVSSLMLSEPTLRLDCTHQGRVCRGCVEYGWSHMQQCREAAKRKKTPRTFLVQGSGEVNGQSFPMLCQSNSVQALSTTDQPVFRNNYARRCKPWFFKMQSTNRRIHPGSSSHEDSHVFRPHYNEQVKNDDPVQDKKLINF